jgi:hypothetical protein
LAVEGKIISPTLEQFRAANVQDMLTRVALRFEPRPEDYARIEIRTKDGRTVQREGTVKPRSKGNLSAWLRPHGERFLSEPKLAKLERLIAKFEDVPDVGEVLACTVPD